MGVTEQRDCELKMGERGRGFEDRTSDGCAPNATGRSGPTVVLMNAVLAQHTRRIQFGSLVHVLTTWHPVRFAEDYALADVLSGGRLLCGLGRGTEPRESNPFDVNVGWNNDPDDVRNREVFEEQVAIF